VLLAHPDPTLALVVDEPVGITAADAALLGIGRRGERGRRGAARLLVEPLVGEIGEIGKPRCTFTAPPPYSCTRVRTL